MEKDLGGSKLSLTLNFPCPKAACVRVLFLLCDLFPFSGEGTRRDVKSRASGFEVQICPLGMGWCWTGP